MAQATAYVTRAELDVIQATLDRMMVRIEVLEEGQRSLTSDLAALAERVTDLSESVDARFNAVDAQFAELRELITDSNASLMSAIMNLAPR